MKPILLKILAILGLKQKKPKTKVGRIVRCLEHVLTVTLLLYLLVLVFPRPLFAHSYEHAGLALYSRHPIPPQNAEALLSQIRARIRSCDIYEDKQKFRIFLCNSKSLYTFFSLLSRNSFGSTQVSGNIMLANVNLSNGTATAFRLDYNERSFVGVASHEIGHVMIRRKFGVWSAYKAPTWLNEGYCEYISGESSFPEEPGNELLSKGKTAEGSSFKYFVYRRMVEFCLTEQDLNITELFSSPPSEKDVRTQTGLWVSRQTSNNFIQSTPNGAPDG